MTAPNEEADSKLNGLPCSSVDWDTINLSLVVPPWLTWPHVSVEMVFPEAQGKRCYGQSFCIILCLLAVPRHPLYPQPPPHKMHICLIHPPFHTPVALPGAGT